MSANNNVSAEHVEAIRIVGGLETDISGGEYISFFRELDNRGTGGITTSWEMEEKVILEGFRLLRYHVLKSQTSNPNVVVLTGEGWVKTIKSKIDAFENSRLVTVSGLLTFLALSSLPGNYKNLILKRGGVDIAMKMLDDYRQDKEICSLAGALLLSLSLNEKEGLNAINREIETIIRQLVSLISRGGYGADFAIRILFQLTRQKKKLPNSTKSLASLVKSVFREEDDNILELVKIMKNKNVRESTVEASVSLLWRLSVPKDESGGGDPCLTSIDTTETIVEVMDMYDSVAIREAACGILANIAIRTKISAELAQKSFSSMQKFLMMENESVDEGLATCAFHAICNVLESPAMPKDMLLDQKMIEIVLSVMGRSPKSEELVEFACLIIGRGCRFDQTKKEMFVSMGAFDLVTNAFEEFVLSREDDPSLDVKDAALCAFATLTGCRSGALAAMNTGLVDIFVTLLAVETDRDFAGILDVIIKNTKKCATDDVLSTSPENTLRNEPQQFSRLMRNSSNSSDISSLINAMLGTHEAPLKAAFCSNDGFTVLMSALSEWIESVQVQESGCRLLAEIYFYLPYPSDAMNSGQGPWSAHNQREALSTISRTMEYNRDSMNIQVCGCNAILNLLHPVSEGGKESLDRQVISPVLELTFKAILECLRVHGADINVQISGISALAISISVAQTEDFRSWAIRIGRRLMHILLQFTGNQHIQALALDALIIIQEAHPTIKSECSSKDINRLITLIDAENNEISGKSSKMLSYLLQNSPESAYRIVECQDYVERIISTTGSKREHISTQLNIYSIFHSLVSISEDYRSAIAVLLYRQNGIHTLCMGVTSHPRNRQLAITTCKILSSIIPFLDATGIAASRDAMKFSLMDLLENHVENLDVEASIFDALYACCGRETHFKEFFLEDTRLRMIINTMQFGLGSESLQLSGCNLLSALSTLASGKEKIGICGGIPVIVNALLAHNASAEVQKHGLGALKNLATAPTNKRIFDSLEAETTVIYALWIHHKDPEVISIGLSALNNIAVDAVSRSVAKMNDQVLAIVIAAMKAFAMNEPVQKNACFYLKTCSYLPENIRIMCENSDILLPLLLKAGDTFPTTCGARSAAVVTKLTSS